MSRDKKIDVPVLDLQTLAVARAGSLFRAQVIRSVGPASQIESGLVVGRVPCPKAEG